MREDDRAPTGRRMYGFHPGDREPFAFHSCHRGETPRVTFRPRVSRAAVLLLLSLVAVAVQGYHFGVDDGAIYLPAVERFVTPGLFPYGADFFLSHSRMSIFS